MRRIKFGFGVLVLVGAFAGPVSLPVAATGSDDVEPEIAAPGPAPVDEVPPTVDIVRPPEGAVYRQGQVVTASYSCADSGGSGVADCSGTVASGARLNTGTVGMRTLTVTATDVAGNSLVVERSYQVVRYRPDLHIRRANQQAFVGNGVYNTTGQRQTVEASVQANGRVTAFFRGQNDGTYRDEFVFRGTGSNQNFTVEYFRGRSNITGAVRNGTYRSPAFGPGGTHTLQVVVTARPSAGPGSRIRVDVRARSVGDTTRQDLVSVTVRRPQPPPPPNPPPPSNCNPNYTPCVPNASDVDCAGGSGNGPAYVQGPVRVIGSDVYGLDSDGDGIGCE